MKLRAIRLENVRRFIDAVEITGIDAGLNVLCLPNERGKSTVFDALQAAFFKDRNCWDKEVRSLAPHAGGDPAVGVEIELAGDVFQIEKRWSRSRRGETRIYSTGRLIHQADDAETWLADALKAPKDGGPAGLLWVRQGESRLDDDEQGRSTRRDLLSSVTGEVETLTGGRRMDAAVERCREDLAAYLTPTGKPRADGPLKRAEDERVALAARRDELAAKTSALRHALERRRELRGELAVLDDPAQDAVRLARLAEAERAHSEAERHVESLDRARAAERMRRLEASQAGDRLAALEANLAEADAAAEARRRAQEEAAETSARQHAAVSAMREAENLRDAAAHDADVAGDTLRNALLAQAAAAAGERRKELAARLESAVALRAAVETAKADAATGIAADVLARLEALAEETRALRRTRDIEAAALTMEYDDGRTSGVSIDGVALPGAARVAIPDGARLEIEGIGRLTVHPGRRADRDALAAAEVALAAALTEAGAGCLESVRASAGRRAEAEARLRDAASSLKAVAPEGIDGLRTTISSLPEPAGDASELPGVEASQQADSLARRAFADASATLDLRREAVGLSRTAAAGAAAALESAEARVARAGASLAGIEDPDAERSDGARLLAELQGLLGGATRQRAAIEAAAPDLAAVGAALHGARSVIDHAEADRQRIRMELGKLDTAIDMQSAEAVEEELADVETRLAAAGRRFDEISFEVAVLRRLAAALKAARATARDRYVEPVMAELRPLLRLLWPEADARFDAEEALPTALVRCGVAEDIEVLSGGTQEQIALLVRLAFARLLARAGSSAPVILDDAIVYSDDDRVERMFDALTRQAKDLQILVFSCRQKAFRDLGGRCLSILPLRRLEAAE